ncbi:MAG: LptF/LptG family permease [Candidatus Lindowbacteria bacterium]|nr:LptF/LptG family permease [Candidatus Lindowbacteria bacterium]
MAKEVIIPSGITFVVITFLMLMGEILHELADRFLSKGLALGDVGMLIFYVTPPLVTYTLPIALLFGTLVAFIQLSQDCEITAMKAAGIPIRKAFAPAVVISVSAALLLLALRAEVSPWAQRKLKAFVIELVLKKPTLVLDEQSWTEKVNDMRIFVGEIDDKRMLLKDINIVVRDKDKPYRTIVSQSGRIYVSEDRSKIFLELKDGSMHEYDTKNPDRYSTTSFSSLTIPASIGAINRYVKRYQSLDNLEKKEMSYRQLFEKLSDPSIAPGEKVSLLKHIGERTALSFMPVAFVLIGAPLGIIPYKARRSYGLAVCAGLLVLYYSLLIIGEALAKRGIVNPLVAMWIPNVFLGTAGVLFMIRAERQ